MNKKDSIWNKVSAPAVLVVLTAVFTGLFIAPSYESARPRSLTLGYDPMRTIGQANGLITFDPLEQAYGEVEQIKRVVDALKRMSLKEEQEDREINREDREKEERDRRERERYSLDTLASMLAEGAKLDSGHSERERLLVLLESVRGGALSEDHERRLRGRYATAAALARERLYPIKSKRLNLLWFEDTAKGAPGRAFADPLEGGVVVPYEFFARDEGSQSPYARVVVCWVDEAAIERNALRFGLEFERRVRDAVSRAGCADVEKLVDVRWLGPTTSGSLKAMLRGFDAVPDERNSSALKIVTPYATAPLVQWTNKVKWEDKGLTLTRAVNTDDVLAGLLVNELMLRVPALMPMHHEADRTRARASPWWARALAAPLRVIGFVPPSKPDQRVRVALVTELDSTYGQAWIENMKRAREALAGKDGSPGPHPQLGRIEFTVFPIFGWVDGITRESSDKKESSAATTVARDYPAEAHQLDYLHRLRDDLQSAGAFSAIAIFVTEEYDTMMILEALRPQFPGAMFLTTDLDARYLHARHAPFTRNLIVASHFGLTPEAGPGGATELQNDGVLRAAPEFRDGYQTGVWHTVRALALGVEPRPPLTASVYEIGRSRAIQLNAQAGASVKSEGGIESPSVPQDASAPSAFQLAASAFAAWRQPSAVHAAESPPTTDEPKSAARPWWVYVWALLSAAALILVLLIFGTRTERTKSSLWHADSKALAALVLIAVVALAAMGFAVLVENTQQRYPAEPMALFEGVSAWPTIALRCLITLVCVIALISIPLRLRRAQIEIAEEFAGLGKDASPVHIAWVLDWPFLDVETNETGDLPPTSRWTRRLRALGRRALGALKAISCLCGVKAPPPLPQKQLDAVWAFVQRAVRRPVWTWSRVVVYGAVLYFGLIPYFMLSGPPSNPVRGEFAYLIERIGLFASVFSFLMLMMLVMETTFFASRLVGQIVNPDAVKLHVPSTPSALDHKVRLELAQNIARVVDPLIWIPMLALALMIVSRASVFDAWPWPKVLIGVFAVFLVMLLMCIVNLRRQCKRARIVALKELSERSLPAGLADHVKEQAARTRKEIEALSGGSFSPLIQHPILHALALPLTAFGTNFVFERNLLDRILGAL